MEFLEGTHRSRELVMGGMQTPLEQICLLMIAS
jgi:hypothetical protein